MASVAPHYFTRLVDPLLKELIADVPAVMLVGPRACGKTTSASRLASTRLRLDRDETRRAVEADPDVVLADARPPVLVDEWQRAPSSLSAANRLIDDAPVPGRFVFTGSASDTLPPEAWPGTGRIVRVPMWGLTQREVLGPSEVRSGTFFDTLADGESLDVRLPDDVPDIGGYVDLLLRSGFPEALARSTERTRELWLDSYVDHVVGRDVDLVGEVRDAARFRRYLTALAANSAGTPSVQMLATSASINRATVNRFDEFLERLFVTEQVPAWASSQLSRLAGTPKRYVCEPALIAAVLGLDRRRIIRDADLTGRLIDSFVASQLRPELQLGRKAVAMFHLRQDGRREVDLVLERRDGAVVAIEVKASANVDERDARHLAWLRDQIGPNRFRAGVVFHTGRHVRDLGTRIWAVPICAIWGR
jgi:predicted AAA+ superfamily ATPase